MGKKEIVIFIFSVFLIAILISGCTGQASEIGVTKQITDTRLYCTVNTVSSVVVDNTAYYLINVTLQNQGPGDVEFTAQDFTLSDLSTDNQNVDIVLDANSSNVYGFYFQKDPLNLGHSYVFGCHDPADIQHSADFELTLN